MRGKTNVMQGDFFRKEENMQKQIHKQGYYKHYKGNYYQVLGVAKHSETLEELVVYQPQYGDFGLWVRPLDMFLEYVEVDGQRMSRFAFVGMTLPENR